MYAADRDDRQKTRSFRDVLEDMAAARRKHAKPFPRVGLRFTILPVLGPSGEGYILLRAESSSIFNPSLDSEGSRFLARRQDFGDTPDPRVDPDARLFPDSWTEHGAAWTVFGGNEILKAAGVPAVDIEDYTPPAGWVAPEPGIDEAGIGGTRVIEVRSWFVAKAA
ncbi:hypothetical protein [Citreimonas salinaria]|uniref:Uncharacterized protein n=1 Tax=Citreimonas salinaria TaxID=321339 RepID=A0A1H3N7D2_9RHOB|nr:hypothetical protein [Citreimonas salinaria]SDY84776.1 hypothetical protein SAMN05444340_12120 [Citreimonas salinaria]